MKKDSEKMKNIENTHHLHPIIIGQSSPTSSSRSKDKDNNVIVFKNDDYKKKKILTKT